LRLTRGDIPCKATVTPLVPTVLFTDKEPTAKIPVEIVGCSGGDASGFLGIPNNPVKDEIGVTLTRAQPRSLVATLFGSLGLALAIPLVCAVIVRAHGHKLGDTIGSPTWDFSSWASNLTAFGAAFSFLIQLSMFPDKPIFGSRTEYGFLAAFAAALVLLAPVVQRLLSKTQVDTSGTTPVMTTHGLVAGFLASSAFTIWGLYLQITIALLVLTELVKAATVTEPMVLPVGICVLLVGIGLGIYCWWTILMTIAANASRTGTATVKPERAMQLFKATPLTPAEAAAGKISLL
jgi:hypothetical protein